MDGPNPIGGPNHPKRDHTSSFESFYPTPRHRSKSDSLFPDEKSSSDPNYKSSTSSKSKVGIKKVIHWVYNPNGSVLVDHHNQPISVDRILATKPLQHELSTRPGPGGKKLTYLSGEGVTRTLNDVFGFDGWNLDVTAVNQVECSKDDSGRYTVIYTAQVRLTHKLSGSYKEDVGAGDATDRCKSTAISNAMKASITDAMKRAARHFGDKLGNCLHQGNFSIDKAPISLQDALDDHAIERANTKFGIAKDISNSGDGGGADTSTERANATELVMSKPSTTTAAKMPNPPCFSTPLRQETLDQAICSSASRHYQRGQTHARQSNYPELPSLTVPPQSSAPSPYLRPRPPTSYGGPYQPSSASTSTSIPCNVANGYHQMSMGFRPSHGRDNSAAIYTGATTNTGYTSGIHQSPRTTAYATPSGTRKRPLLNTIPSNILTTVGNNGSINGDIYGTKGHRRSHPSTPSNPYHTAAVSSSSSTASSSYPLKAGRYYY